MNATVTLVCCAALATNAAAQTTKYGPLAFRLPASARAVAMGDIAVAGRDDDVIFYNPAQLVVARGTSLSVDRTSRDIRGGTMSTVLRLGSAGLGIGVNYLEYRAADGVFPISRDDIIRQRSDRPAGSSTLATLGFAQVFRNNRFGASANYGVDEIGFDRFRSVAADVGLARDFGRYTAGLSLQHLGRSTHGRASPVLKVDSVRPPMKATLGAGWSSAAGPLDITATAAVSAMREGHVSPAVGAEASWSWLSGYAISARGGARYLRGVGDAKYTGGVGFVADRVAIDVAAEVLSNDRVGYRAGFRIR